MANDLSRVNSSFLQLVRDIESELFSVSRNIEGLLDRDLTDSTYLYYSRQLDHIQDMFDRSSEIARQLTLDQSNPAFYELLEAKKDLSDKYGILNRIRNAFSSRYEKLHPKETQQEQSLVREREIVQNAADEEVEDLIPHDEITDAGIVEDENLEAFLNAEDARAAKNQERKERQKRLADEARKRERQRDEYRKSQDVGYAADVDSQSAGFQHISDSANQEQLHRQEVADQMAMRRGEGQEFSEADLRNERLRQDDARIQKEEAQQARLQHEQEVFQEHLEKMEKSQSFEGLGSGHIDYSKEFGGVSEESFSGNLGYSPFGTIPLYDASPVTADNKSIHNNAEIYESLHREVEAFTETTGKSVPISPAYEQQMAFNLENARLDYEAARGSAGEQAALDRYMEQRSGIAKFREDVQSGRIHIMHREIPLADHDAFLPPGMDSIPLPGSMPSAVWASPQQPYFHDYFHGHVHEKLSPVRAPQHAETAFTGGSFKHDDDGFKDNHDVSGSYAGGRRNVSEKEPQEAQNPVRQPTLAPDDSSSRLDSVTFRGPSAHEDQGFSRDSLTGRHTAVPGSSAVFASYTPTGVAGNIVSDGKLSNSSFSYTNPGLRDTTFYTADSPLKVHPKYEEEIIRRKDIAVSVMNAYLAKGSFVNIPPSVTSELRLATEAYLGYRTAKDAGAVVVSNDAKKVTPDYDHWRQRQQVLGTTCQPHQNANRPQKADVEEPSASVFKYESKLKRESIAKQYFRSAGYKFSDYNSLASTMLARKMYMLLQDGDDNALRTFETGRYYISTGVAVGLAIHRAAPVYSMAQAAEKYAKIEFRRFGNMTLLDKNELSARINAHRHSGIELKKEIKALMNKGSLITDDERAQLSELMYRHLGNSQLLRKEIGFRQLHHKHQLSLSLAQELKSEHKGFVTIRHVDQKMMEIRKEAYDRMSKKFGSLSKVTDASLAKEIASLKKQGKKLKAQIQVLKNKGSAMTTVDAKRLQALTKQHQQNSKKLRKLFGLKQCRDALEEKMDILTDIRGQLAKNASARRAGSFALQNLLLRPIFAGDEIGAQGLARGIRITMNPYVVRFMKANMKVSMKFARRASRATMDLISPGTTQAIDASVTLAKQLVNAKVAAGKKVIKTSITRTVSTSKHAISRLVPRKIKTAVNTTVRTSRAGFASVKNAIAAGKQWVANTRVYKVYSSVRNFGSNVAHGVKAALAFLKTVLMKVLIVFAVFMLICAILSVILTSITSVSTSSVIMSPYTAEDGRISLKPYVEILDAKQAEFDAQIAALKSNAKYEYVYVQPMSDTLNNYQEILSMMGVRMSHNLSLETNTQIKPFLENLFDVSHDLTSNEVYREHDPGCKTKIVAVTTTNEYGQKETVYKKDENGEFILDANGNKIPVTEEVRYCPGHWDLYIQTYVLTFDALFDAAAAGETGIVGTGIGTFSDTLGGISAKYEAGGINPGRISSSSGLNGKNYGTWQITISQSYNTLATFVSYTSSHPDIYNRLKNLTLGSEAFDEAWQSCALDYPDEFQLLQAAFIYQTHVLPFINNAKEEYGVDLSRNRALLEMAFSTAVQFGPGGTYALGNINSDMTDEEIIQTCYAAKRDNVNTWFSGTSAATRESLKKNRFVKEEQDILSLLGSDEEMNLPSSEVTDAFWTEESNREWAKLIYEQDWELLYDVSFSRTSGAIITPMLDAEVEKVLEACKAEYPEMSAAREESIRIALSLVGRVQYYWGGGHETSLEPGWNDKWGTPAPPSSSGTTTYYTWGLDCSGFIRWVYLTQYGEDKLNSTAHGIRNMNNAISRAEAKPGDLANVPGSSRDVHIGMYLYTKEDGTRVFVHSGGGKRGVQLTTEAYGFEYYHRPYFYND